MSAKDIRHEGIIKSIEGNKYVVTILQKSACGSCAIKGACGGFEMSEKEIEAYDFSKTEWKIGEKVNVCMQRSMGSKAVLIGYVIPLFFLFAGLVPTILITNDEISGTLAGLLSLGLYYSVIYFFRDKLNNSFKFTLSKITDYSSYNSSCEI